MDFNNSARSADVTADDSPSSEHAGFLHPFARRLARGALVALSRAGDRVLARGSEALALAEGIVTAADAIVDGLDRLDECAQPKAPAVDLGMALQVEQLAERVARLEARHPARVMERRRSPFPCSACGSTTVEVLEGVVPSGDSVPALCAGCGQPWYTHKTAEVLP